MPVKNKQSLALALPVFIACALFATRCSKAPALSQESVRFLIESSQAFRAPVDPGVVFLDSSFRPGPSMKREFLALRGLVVKPDGPFGMAGSTATAAFTWRWNEGPLAGQVFQSKARLNSSGGTWKVYEDYLKHELWTAERGEE
jgi:hypothetical protein